ncbi:MAG: LPS export ABC transporter periplasmic protein LptC [Elusimicrobiota bacterium]|jgi:LPS export ABC transporter protein LptC|nr:LPS export ABC transporter periplasmic protein LptC [Elusimicrobiota bacterium]
MRFYKKIFLIFFLAVLSACEKEIIPKKHTSFDKQRIEQFVLTETKDGKLKTILAADYAEIDEKNNTTHLRNPEIKFYSDGKYTSTLTSESADVNLTSYDVSGNGKCSIEGCDGERLDTTDLKYDAEKDLFYSDNPVKIKKGGKTLYGQSFKSDTKLSKITIEKQVIEIEEK